MPLPVIADVFRCALEWTDSNTGFPATNVFHVKTATSGKTSGQVFTCLDAHVTAAMWDWTAATAQIQTVEITPLDGVSAAASFSTGAAAKWRGGGLGTSLPQVAGIVKFGTGLRGPANRGRMYMPFVGEGEVAGNVLIDAAAVQAAWISYAANLISDGTTPMALGIASYVHGNFHQTTLINAELQTATQRRRNRRS